MGGNRHLGAALAAGLLVVMPLAGCGQATSQVPGTSRDQGINALADPAAVPALITAKVGADPTVRRLSLNDNGFSVEVRDPDKPENLDTYSYYAGSWSTAPVFMSQRDIDELDEVTFRLSQVQFDRIPALIGMATEGLSLEGEKPTGVSYDRIAGDPVRVYVSVRGLRGSGHLLARADGTHATVTRD